MKFDAHLFWAPQIAADWQWQRVAESFKVINGFPFESEHFNVNGAGFPLVRIRDILSTDLPTAYDGANGLNCVVQNEDIVVGMDGDFNCAWWSKGDALLNQRVAALRAVPTGRLDPRFAFYQIPYGLKVINDLTPASTVKHLSSSDIAALRLPAPDLPTQKRIAAFLDRETARIDELIAKKERLVEVQRLRLQSSLQEMVLGGAEVQRGLGGDWLQSLSDGWCLMPLKHLVTTMGGATPSKDREDFWTGDIPWVSPKDMKTDVITDVPDHVSQAALDGSAIQMVPEQAVLIVVRGMILARLVPVCRLGVPATINQDMKALLPRTKVIRGDYLQRMLQGFGDVLMSFIEEAAHGTKKLRSDALFGLKFPVPPLGQQEQIAGQYEAARASAEKIEDATRKSIDRLREYRAALITAAVTGQIDVDTYGKAGTTSAALDRIEEEMQA